MDIKVQRGVAIIPEDETTLVVELKQKVNPDKAVVLFGGSICGSSYNYASSYWDARLVLLDSKHIEVKRAYPFAYTAEIAWQVVEAVPDKPKRKLYGTYVPLPEPPEGE